MTTYQQRLQANWPAHRGAVIVGVSGSLTLGLAPFYPHAHIHKQIMNIVHEVRNLGGMSSWS